MSIQADKAVNEFLYELLNEEKYSGYVDIWPVISVKKGKVILEMHMKKITLVTQDFAHKDSTRYLVVPGKGCKLISQV